MLLIATCKNTKNSIFLKLKNPITMHITHVIGFLFLLKIREIFIFNIMFTAFIKILPVGYYESASDPKNFNTSSAGNHSHTVTVNNTGSNTAHNNMQPYISVYIWKRTA